MDMRQASKSLFVYAVWEYLTGGNELLLKVIVLGDLLSLPGIAGRADGHRHRHYVLSVVAKGMVS